MHAEFSCLVFASVQDTAELVSRQLEDSACSYSWVKFQEALEVVRPRQLPPLVQRLLMPAAERGRHLPRPDYLRACWSFRSCLHPFWMPAYQNGCTFTKEGTLGLLQTLWLCLRGEALMLALMLRQSCTSMRASPCRQNQHIKTGKHSDIRCCIDMHIGQNCLHKSWHDCTLMPGPQLLRPRRSVHKP